MAKKINTPVPILRYRHTFSNGNPVGEYRVVHIDPKDIAYWHQLGYYPARDHQYAVLNHAGQVVNGLTYGQYQHLVAIVVERPHLRERFADTIILGIDEARKAERAGRKGWSFATEEAGRALAERYSWARVGETWCRLLETERAKRVEVSHGHSDRA